MPLAGVVGSSAKKLRPAAFAIALPAVTLLFEPKTAGV
jgi:hypothetical protein